ncbi:long-chain-fatty-acid--CoA ligase [Alphaproteobacteria bacterium]|nr:long-chain-fatty-acid--CoA ligase [Alphaproteobacteria bacterium]
MLGLMQDHPLLISSIFDHAVNGYGNQDIVSNSIEGGMHKYNYSQWGLRTKKLANAFKSLNLSQGDKVGTLAWNGYRHLEIYYASSSSGLICHTVNPRLHPDQIAYIVNHAEDKVLCVDLNILPLVEKASIHFKTVKTLIVMTDNLNMINPQINKDIKVVCYEDFIKEESSDFNWPELDEKTASSLCYTSGTTGNPKGVLYSHRSTVLHAYGMNLKDVVPYGVKDVVLPVVPMFHVNAWGTPYAAPMCGAKLVFPGMKLDGESLTDLMNNEQVTVSLGVPTIWLALLNYLRESGKKLDTVKRLIIGGSSCPRTLFEGFEEEFGVEVIHAWGMTEMSPLGTVNMPSLEDTPKNKKEYYDQKMPQGRTIFGHQMKLVDDDGNVLPEDGETQGRLLSRGLWVLKQYYKDDSQNDRFLDGGWFDTGDVAKIDQNGFMTITDRTKDIIKSGGEWISSIDLENICVGHPEVANAAVISVPHEKWEERPIVIVQPMVGKSPSKVDILKMYEGKIAKWMIPDDVIFTDIIPLGATGKILKNKLREEFGGHTIS